MGKSDTARAYKAMSPADQRTFDRWLKANAIFGLIFAVAIVAMALAGFWSAGKGDAAIADVGKAGDTGALNPAQPAIGMSSTD
jgi:hypothetical protein